MTNKKILGTTKVTYKYQITIPKEVRNSCGFGQGDLLVFEKDGEKLCLRTNSES
ncbi:MAG: AbrB/MazE/SpoVT family DNA-binding domain-containing protein [Nitrosopumilus sp. H13]|nr:MAG: AbrB/MazE/SpoVT family DNA-binding domain-containing protein [Nitrosopumilus sp. H13]